MKSGQSYLSSPNSKTFGQRCGSLLASTTVGTSPSWPTNHSNLLWQS